MKEQAKDLIKNNPEGQVQKVEVVDTGGSSTTGLPSLIIHRVDPTGNHVFSDEELSFIQVWMQYKNIDAVTNALNKPYSQVLTYLSNYYVWGEIQRLEKESAKNKTSQKVMTLDDIQAYLTSAILDYNIPLGDRLSNRDKLQAIKLLLETKEMQSNAAVKNSEIVDASTSSNDLQSLSADTIKALLNTHKEEVKSNEEKEKIIKELIPLMKLSPSEIASLKSKSKEELEQMEKESKKNK